MSDENLIAEMLRADGQLAPGRVVITALAGGVSCEIYRVEQGVRQFVVKRALERLRVAEEWRADTSRNETEFAFYDALTGILADAIPRVFFHNPERGYFIMEYLEESWRNWKGLLLKGCFDASHGTLAGTLLAKLHRGTWNDQTFRARFNAASNFRELRTDPYFRAAAAHHPELREGLQAVAEQLDQSRICLIHGDFSPKNILIHEEQMVLLDAEVAYFGDPAFDVAFLQSHLFLKGLHFSPRCVDWEAVSITVWDAYRSAMEGLFKNGSDFERHCIRMLGALLVARVDGKSPVEYLTDNKREIVRRTAARLLQCPPPDFRAARVVWGAAINAPI